MILQIKQVNRSKYPLPLMWSIIRELKPPSVTMSISMFNISAKSTFIFQRLNKETLLEISTSISISLPGVSSLRAYEPNIPICLGLKRLS